MNFGHVLLFALLDTDVCKWGNITAVMSQQLKQNRFAEFSKSRQLYAGAETQMHFGGTSCSIHYSVMSSLPPPAPFILRLTDPEI